jgi:outer membrane protein TolC
MRWLTLLLALWAAPAFAGDGAPRAATAVTPFLPLFLETRADRAADAREREAPDPGDVLTLEEALALAQAHNRGIKNSALAVGAAGDQIVAAKAQMFPKLQVSVTPAYQLTPLDVTFDAGSLGTYPDIGPVPARDTTLRTTPGFTTIAQAGVAQPLSQLYALGLTVDQLGVSRDMLRQDLRRQRQTVASTVKQAYYAVLQTQSALQALSEQVASDRELLRIVTEQAAREAALPAHVLQVKVSLARSEYAVLTTEHALASQKERLNFVLGRDPSTAFRVAALPGEMPLPASLDAARDAALRQRPDLHKARLQVEHADYAVRLSRAAYIPDVSLVLKYFSPLTSDQLPRHIAYTGIELSWDVWDWGKKRHNVLQSEKAREQARNAAEDAAQQVVLDVNNAVRRLQDADAFLRVAELGRDAARESLRVVTNQFGQRAALLKDVLAAQAAVAQANDQYRQAALSVWEARAGLDKALGADQ